MQDQGAGSAGYVFRVTFEGDQAATFFGDSNNRIGFIVPEEAPIDNESNDGAETFYISDADVNEVIPEPVTFVVLLAGTFGLLALRKRHYA